MSMVKTADLLGQVYGRWRLVAQRLMEPFPVVTANIACQMLAGALYALVVSPIDLLVFDTPPQPLHPHVVQGPPAAIHADSHASLREPFSTG
jgi:hypothetical protein